MKSILTAIGTRPEAIKLAPVLAAMQKKTSIKSEVCITRQHKELIEPFLKKPEIEVSYMLDYKEGHLPLHQSAATMLEQFGDVLEQSKPDLVVVQGDTTTAFVAALTAYYARIPVAHVEAGLRTGHPYSPWPEEVHRSLIGRLSSFFFAPTPLAQKVLEEEGVPPERIWMVGNTSVDAMRLERKSWTHHKVSKEQSILVTVHRKENQGPPLREICQGLCWVAKAYPTLQIRFVLHPNPQVRSPAQEMLAGVANIQLQDPVDHPSFIRMLSDCLFVITDSGGIQEEAPSIGKPVLVVRNTTERPEGVELGTARLVGTQASSLLAACRELLEDTEAFEAMSKVHFPYGDGYAADRIVDILDRKMKEILK